MRKLQNLVEQCLKNSIEDIQEQPQSQNIAYEWHQEEEQTKHGSQYTSHKPKKAEQSLSLPKQGDHDASQPGSTKHNSNTIKFQNMKSPAASTHEATQIFIVG